jgi:hypothetical protein
VTVAYLRRFAGFWVDFIIGDAWEVAAGLGLALVLLAFMSDRWDDGGLLGLVLVAAVLGFAWLALLRATARERRSDPTPASVKDSD